MSITIANSRMLGAAYRLGKLSVGKKSTSAQLEFMRKYALKCSCVTDARDWIAISLYSTKEKRLEILEWATDDQIAEQFIKACLTFHCSYLGDFGRRNLTAHIISLARKYYQRVEASSKVAA